MGHLSDPPIAEFALKLRDRIGINRLVETGTYQGESTQWAALNFENVDTLDIDEGFVHHAMTRCDGLENIRFRLGDSRAVLPRVVARLDGPALFWLDAHNAAGIFGDGPDDCPILEELMTILCSPHRHAILIDDACCFIPPQPHDPKAYPEIGRIKAMAREAGRLCDVAHDVIAIIPPDLEKELGDFTRSNYAVMHGFVPGGRRRFSVNLMRRQPFAVRATVAVGPATPEIEPPPPPPENLVSEVARTRYGDMILPACDTNQTPPLRSAGIAQQWYEIDYLISLLEQKNGEKRGAVFLDVGANVGTFSFALRPYCSAVYAYEPQRLIFNMLAGSVALNGWTNVYCYNVAVGDHHGTVEVPQFDYTKPCSFGSIEFGERQRERLAQERGDDKDERISLVPLDMWNFRRVDLIKIDVEGMEMQVLAGAAKTIGMHRPMIMIEHGKVDKPNLQQKLTSLGYIIRDLGGDFIAMPEVYA